MHGTVKWFDNKKGYGFIARADNGEDLFVYHTAVQGTGFKTLNQGDEVTFDVTTGDKGNKAAQVRVSHAAPRK